MDDHFCEIGDHKHSTAESQFITAVIQDIIEMLAGINRRSYRAHASLGGAIDAVLKPITRTNSPENDRDYCPDSLSFNIGQIEIQLRQRTPFWLLKNNSFELSSRITGDSHI